MGLAFLCSLILWAKCRLWQANSLLFRSSWCAAPALLLLERSCLGNLVPAQWLGDPLFVSVIHHVLPLPAADSKEARRACLDRYREKKRHRAAAGSKIRYEMRRVNAEQRPRFKVGIG